MQQDFNEHIDPQDENITQPADETQVRQDEPLEAQSESDDRCDTSSDTDTGAESEIMVPDDKLAELEQDIDRALEESISESESENENDEFSQDDSDTPATSLTRDQIVEAVLFSSDGPLPAAKIASVIGAISTKEIREIIDRLNSNYQHWNCSFHIQEIAGGFQMMTCPQYATYLQQLYKVRSESKLSGAALETLAVIAYKQPVLRAEIEAIRGVACGEMIRTLMEKDLVKIVGRAEELGRPMLYGTTKRFLQVFGLASLEDLPKVPELLPPSKTPKPGPEESDRVSSESQSESQPDSPQPSQNVQNDIPEPELSSPENHPSDLPGDDNKVDADRDENQPVV